MYRYQSKRYDAHSGTTVCRTSNIRFVVIIGLQFESIRTDCTTSYFFFRMCEWWLWYGRYGRCRYHTTGGAISDVVLRGTHIRHCAKFWHNFSLSSLSSSYSLNSKLLPSQTGLTLLPSSEFVTPFHRQKALLMALWCMFLLVSGLTVSHKKPKPIFIKPISIYDWGSSVSSASLSMYRTKLLEQQFIHLKTVVSLLISNKVPYL